MVGDFIDTCMCTSLQFHDVLHRLHAVRETGMAIMELKLAQDLSKVDHSPLFLFLLDLRKAYNTVDRERLIYGAGPLLCGLLDTFWYHQQAVLRQNGFHGPAFPATWITTKGSLVSPTLFNVVVDNVIRT